MQSDGAESRRTRIENLSARCMVCGAENPHSMGVQFDRDGPDVVSAETTIPAQYQGFDGIAHGGSIAAVLDDAMWWAIYRGRDACTMTAEMTVRYREPVTVGERVRVLGRVVSQRRQIFVAEAAISAVGDDGDGALLASAEGKYIISDPERS